jgi:Domain of unknown function (DUF4118)
MDSAHRQQTVRSIAIVAGPLLALLVAWLLTFPSDGDDAGVTLANVALTIAVVTVGVAVVDWVSGVVTSVIAALALNYFHTEPIHTLRINDRRDIYSVLLLGALGLAVSAVTAIRVRSEVRGVTRRRAVSAGGELAALLGDDRPAASVWSMAISAAANDLDLLEVRVSAGNPAQLPIVGRHFVEGDDATLTIPAVGAALRLQQSHPEGRWLVLTPRSGHAPLDVDRRAVLSFADTVELALESALRTSNVGDSRGATSDWSQ